MSNMSNRRLVLIILAVVLLLSAFFAYRFWKNQQFRVTNTTPSLSGTVATSTSIIKLDFNRDLKDDEPYNMTIIGEESTFVRQVVRDGRSLKLRLRPLDKDQTYTLLIKKVIAADGSVLENIQFKFKVNYIQHNKLSADQKALELSETDRNNYSDPILSHIPHSTLVYSITPLYSSNNVGDDDYEESAEAGQSKYVLTLEIKIMLSNADRNNTTQAITEYKQQALNYIKDKGFNPDDYTIKYTVIDPIF